MGRWLWLFPLAWPSTSGEVSIFRSPAAMLSQEAFELSATSTGTSRAHVAADQSPLVVQQQPWTRVKDSVSSIPSCQIEHQTGAKGSPKLRRG